ncbi:SspB-related isopeptide-forming adhesin [Streptococcus salivarius]
MKDIFNRRQRFSLRKYSFGVASVLLGTALFAASIAQADEVTSPEPSSSTPSSTVAGESSANLVETPTTSTAQADPTAAVSSTEATASTFNLTPEASTDKAAAETTDKQATETAKPEASKPASETAKPTEKPTSEAAKPATAASTNAASNNVETTASTTTASNAPTTAASAAGNTAAAETAEAAVEATSVRPNVTARAFAANTDANRSATLDRAATDMTNGGALATSRSRRGRRAVTDHNYEAVSVEHYLKDGETATPDMTDPNGASVRSQTVPSGYSAKEGDVYTYSIVDLTRFNERYNTNYYVRAYKRFDASTDTTVELMDKNTGNVVETRTITASSGIQKFTTTKSASRGELTFQVDYDKGLGAGPGKTDQPFIQFGYEVGASIQALVNPKNEAEQKLYQDVYNARTSTDIINVVEPAYNGRTITDTNAKIPVSVNKTTYYRVVDKNNSTFNANKTDKTVQDYVPNGNEVDLAKYTLKAMEGQNFTASGERQFDGYKLYQTADANDQSGYVSRPYKVGTKFMDAERAGIKRIKEIVGEDGTVVVRVYLLDPKQQSKRSDGTLSTDGYMLLAETKPIKPGDYNKEDLVVKKSPLNTIAFTDNKGVNHPNGVEVPFDFQKADGYTPKKTVFVPFLGDGIGHLSPNSQLENGAYVKIGTNVDLLNTLTPYKQPIYYYVKQEPVEVTPEVEKQLEGRVLANGEFSFKLKEVQPNKLIEPYEETVTNKADGKATFSKLTFNKAGTYTYTITETPGSDANVEYDAMTVTMTVTVTENAQGELQAAVKYSAEGGFKSSADDKIFNNYVVAPVKTKFDFTKKLAGRELKDGEFKFVLKDANGQEVETVTNKADGTVTFTELSFDNSKVGTHTYTVEEVIPAAKEAGMVYDTMKATITVEVAKNGHTLTTVTNVSSTGGVDANGNATDGTADKEFNNKITPPETPEFQPEKFVLNKEKFDIKGESLLDDDDELQDEYTETNANPYADQTKNNEAENINTKTVERGDKLVYQVWLDTKNFTDKNNIQSVGISDTYDADKLTVNAADIKAYDSVTGVDVTSKFDITVANGVITATSKTSMNKSLGDADNTQVIDTTKFAFGRYYKFDIPATVKADVPGGVDIENKANQIVHVYNPVSKSVETPEKPTQKRVNSVPITAEFNFTKRLEGRELKANEFSFVLKDSTGKVVETVSNDAAGNVKFSALKFKKGEEGAHKYTVEEVAGTDTTVTYDTMKAEVTVTVSHDGTAKALVANVTEPADKEFNNTVTPPTEPKFQPEKYVLNTEKYSITDNKLLDDDSELTDKYGETNTDPYVDGTSNNEAENINTKTVNRGDKIYYQVWLDTTKFSATNKENVQSVGITDDFDETKVDVDSTKIKAYDSVTGDDVTNKFDIKVENGVMTATLKAGFTKSLGDAENTQIIDTTKFAFGRYYKFDIPATVKADVAGGVDIENTAAQVVNYYNPVSKTVEKPNKPTEKRVNSVPVSVEFNFTKRLEGRELKANEFSFVLKDSTGKVVETVSNDADGNVKFSAIEFKKEQAGVHNYTVEEVAGTDATVTYDTMKANVTVTVSHDGTAKVLVATVGDIADKEFNNTVTPPTEPKFQPEKYVVSEEKFDITGDKLVDDDKELANKYADTNANPYADDASNNEEQNLNTKTVKRGDKLVYQVWLDTTKFSETNKENVQSVGISDDYDEAKLDLDATKIKAYDSVTGDDVTAKFDITVNNGVITATLKAGFTKSLGDAENTQVIDTTKFAFGRYYKFDIPTTVKADVEAGVDIENTAAQVVNYYNPTTKKVETPNKPTQKRVNSVPVPVEFNFTKRLEGRELKANEFSFVLKDSTGKVVETVSNDKDGNVKFSAIEFKKEQAGVHNYTVEEVAGTDATVTYDTMKANVTVTVSHDGTAKVLVATVGDIADKEFNNVVTPPTEPKFQPEKYVVSEEKFDITGDKLVDDDKELANKYADTNANPYADDASNNEEQNLNTKTVKRGDKLVYQVWLDTTKFSETNKENVQSVGISDDYDEAKLDLDATKIKAYDSVTGDDVTAKFDITVNNGVITATLKAGFTKSLGDAENTQVIDTTKFAFGRYYKFDIPTTVKADVEAGVDIENTAAQVVNYYNPTTKKVETPNKPTQKRVNSVPVPVEFNFTKRLEGRELKANEFSFVLKDSTGKVVETVSNDKDGNVKFSAIEFKKEQAGVHNYTVEEVAGTDATVTYDTMKANVTVTVSHDGTAKVLVATVGDIADKEFNNVVTPPTEPKFQPEKYVLNTEKFSITDNKLLDDDAELADKYADTKANPYADLSDGKELSDGKVLGKNEAENINTKAVNRGDKLVYQVWLDTTKFSETNKENIQSVGITDDYDEAKLELDTTKIKAYDSVTGADVTDKFDITVEGGVITATLKAGFTKSLGDAENTQVIDTTKFAFGRYYKFDIPTTVKADVAGGVDIENTAAQVVNYYNPVSKTVEKPNVPTQKRVNSVPVQVEFNFTKRLEGRDLKANEFSFVLKDSTGKVVETVSNDADGNVKFSAIEFKKEQAGVHNYTVEEVAGTDATVTYDTMKANVTVTVSHDGTAKVLVATVGDIADKEFNNVVTPPTEPKFQPEKYVLSKDKGEFDITGTKLLDDDAELTDKYGETNTDPYVDKTDNNEKIDTGKVDKDEKPIFDFININTQPVKRGDTINYQVWLDTTQFDANNKDNIQSVGITDTYDKAKLEVSKSAIKAYDGKSGDDVTDKFDITVEGGVITANLKAGFTKSLGDAENTQVIDTTKFEFGRYYKFVIPATVSSGAFDGAEIENTAAQVVNYYNPVSKTVEKPNKPTEKRVNNVPTAIELIFGKTLNGRQLKDKEFTFELKDEEGNVLETVKNDAEGKVKFSTINYAKADLGKTFNYTVEEVKGTDTTVTYDNMKVNVTVQVIQPSVGDQLSTVISYATVGGDAYGADDRVFDNEVTPNFTPEKYVVSEPRFDIIGNKLADDDKELEDKYADTNAKPYADVASNNEKENLNTKSVERGQKIYYQVWLDTREFTAENNLQTVGIKDNYEKDKLDINADDIKVYDGITGEDVTAKFDINVENGVISASSKASLTKPISATDASPVIDTTKFEFGRYYKFDIPATVKQTVKAGVDIENTANQTIHQYNPFNKKVKDSEKPTQKRVNSVPVQVEFNFTKRLEGRELKANEFSFVLKDSTGKVVETVSNDASGNVKFSAIEFKKEQAGVHNYTVEEVKGTDATVTYDTMKANVTVTVSHDGTAKALVANVTEPADKEFNNTVTPPETPEFNPEKYVLNKEKFSITDNKLLDDDKELADKYADTNANPYADDASNNEAENINTKTVKPKDKLVYQVWLDTTKFSETNKENIQSVGISDDYDEAKLDLDSTKIKAYDSVTGDDVTDKFDITVNNGVITATLKAGFTKSLGDADNTQVIDTTKFAFGRYYKFDIPTTVKADVAAGVDIENTAAQVVNYYNPVSKSVEKPSKPTEKRVNSVPVQVEFNFTKRLEGRELKADEFSFVLKDSTGKVLETVSNDAAGNVKFSAIEFKKEQAGVHNFTVEEVKGTDGTVTYDAMKANVTVTVSHDGTAKVLVATVGEIAHKEFNNTVKPPETPEFNPEKYVLNEKEFDLTGTSLLDDDKELADKYADTNANPYADDASNNEAANINTKSVKPGQKLVYQVWLDTTKFDANNKDHIQSVGISDDYDEAKVDVDASAIKAYDGKTGADVTDKFDITVANGVITATLKAGFTKSLGDAENTQVIDTTKFEFGRYYKFDIPATVKADVAGGVDIENTAAQVVNYYNPVSKTVEKPNKPTEKRVNSVPVQVEFKFTKRMEGRELKANEFSFVLKDSTGKVLETVSNDASGNVKFSKLEFKKGQEGTHNYTVEEVKGTDGSVAYDEMKAVVTVEVKHDGTAKALITNVTDPADKEFNNRVTPPETPDFNPEKYILNESKFDITGDKLLDDDKELKDKIAETNENPYVDKTDNNEAQNINTKTLKKGDKVYYQVWLDTTKFTEAHNIQSVGVTDKYDSANLSVNKADIKAYDSVTGEDVTAKFDIKVENGVITATSKADLTKSLGDAENTQVIDTTKFAFGRYYKFEIPAEIKQSAKDGVDIENTASQIVHQYDPTKKSVEKPEKPTEKRVINIPTKVEFEFTKKLEGRQLKAGEFSFVLKDSKGNVIETVSNDAKGKIKFSALEYKRGEEGTHIYTVEEVQGNDTTVTYDKMVARVVVSVTKDGKVLTVTSQLPEDTEFNNIVTPPTPPTPPTPVVPPVTPPTPPTPVVPPVTPPTTPEAPKGPALPETGDDASMAAMALGGILAAAGLGLAGKRKKED